MLLTEKGYFNPVTIYYILFQSDQNNIQKYNLLGKVHPWK
jgi:hypothetical protein